MATLRMLRQECETCGKAASVEVITIIGALVGRFCKKHGMAKLAELEKAERSVPIVLQKNPVHQEAAAAMTLIIEQSEATDAETHQPDTERLPDVGKSREARRASRDGTRVP